MASRTPLSSQLTRILVVVSCLAASACKVPEAESPTVPASPNESGEPTPGATSVAPEAASTSPAADGTAPAAPAPGTTPAPGATPGAPPAASNERPGPPLPELRVKSFGLHVGGAAKDTELRREVQRTLERKFPRYLDCYRLIDQPGSEGTFGADIRVAAEGGKPTVGQPRTALRGEAFRACMVKAFESARFEPPSSGRALVVSYSVKFSFGW